MFYILHLTSQMLNFLNKISCGAQYRQYYFPYLYSLRSSFLTKTLVGCNTDNTTSLIPPSTLKQKTKKSVIIFMTTDPNVLFCFINYQILRVPIAIR